MRVQLWPSHQRPHDLPHKMPAHLQALDRIAVLHVPREHHHELASKITGVPRHLRTRNDVLDSFKVLLPWTRIILDSDEAHVHDPPHRRREDQVPLLVHREAPQLLFGCTPCQPRHAMSIKPRASPRIHAIVHPVMA